MRFSIVTPCSVYTIMHIQPVNHVFSMATELSCWDGQQRDQDTHGRSCWLQGEHQATELSPEQIYRRSLCQSKDKGGRHCGELQFTNGAPNLPLSFLCGCREQQNKRTGGRYSKDLLETCLDPELFEWCLVYFVVEGTYKTKGEPQKHTGHKGVISLNSDGLILFQWLVWPAVYLFYLPYSM